MPAKRKRMHIQRFHLKKLLVLIVTKLLVVYCLHRFFATNHDSSKNSHSSDLPSGEEEDRSAVGREEERMYEALSWTGRHTCPVCLGENICETLEQGFITVGNFPNPKGRKEAGIQEFTALTKEEKQLAVLVPEQHGWDVWDELICKNSSQMVGCRVAEAVKGSFLGKTTRVPAPVLHNLGVPTGWSPHALTACATSSLTADLREAFDQNKDGVLSPEEKFTMTSTVAVAPSLALLRIGELYAVPYFPRYLGSCGRVLVAEGELTPLPDWPSQDLASRTDLALQILSIIGGMLTGESLLIGWQLGWDSFAVRPTGQVVLSRLDRLTSIESSLISKPKDEQRDICNAACFAAFQKDVFQATPRGQPGKGCSAAMLYGDMMLFSVCRNILSKSEEERAGLLDGAEEGVLTLLADCVEEKERGQRWRAMDSMVELLTAGDRATDRELGSSAREEVENSAKEVFDKEDEDKMRDQENDFMVGSDEES